MQLCYKIEVRNGCINCRFCIISNGAIQYISGFFTVYRLKHEFNLLTTTLVVHLVDAQGYSRDIPENTGIFSGLIRFILGSNSMAWHEWLWFTLLLSFIGSKTFVRNFVLISYADLSSQWKGTIMIQGTRCVHTSHSL